jgi:hypothetical protein
VDQYDDRREAPAMMFNDMEYFFGDLIVPRHETAMQIIKLLILIQCCLFCQMLFCIFHLWP